MSLQVHQGTVLFGSDMQRGRVTRPKDSVHANGNAHLTIKKELQSFLGMMILLGKFSPSNAEVCKPLQKLT